MDSRTCGRMTAIALLALSTVACASWLPSPKRVEVQQGNVLSNEDIALLEPGLSRSRVRELLGGSVLAGSFQGDRLDYIYYRTEAGRAVGEPERLTLHFAGDELTRVVDHYETPDDPMPELADGPLPERNPAPAPAPAGGGPADPGRTTGIPGPG